MSFFSFSSFNKSSHFKFKFFIFSLREEKEKNEKLPNAYLKELIKKGKISNIISIRETENYTKKIDKKDKVKLMNLVKALKNSEI